MRRSGHWPCTSRSFGRCWQPAARQTSLDPTKQHMLHSTAMHATSLFHSVLLGEVCMRIASRQQGVQRSCNTPDFVVIRPIRGLDPILLF